MMHRALRFALALALASVLPAAEWTRFESPAFDVYTDAGERPGRAAMVWFEQFRHVLGQMLGAPDLTAQVPVRILVYKRNPPAPTALAAGRERWIIPLKANATPPPELLRDLAGLYLDSVERLPAPLERGLIELFATIEIATTRVTAGAPPANPDQDWALIHMLVVDPEYSGKLRALLYNLRRGVDDDAAYGNAFGKTPAQVRKQAEGHFAARNFQTVQLSGRPVAPRDFFPREADPAVVAATEAELKAATPEQARKLRYLKSEPHFEAAKRATDPQVRIKELRAAVALAPRRDDYWQALAQVWLDQRNFREAARAWKSAEQAAVDAAQRERVRQARMSIEQQRLDFEAAEKRRIAEEKERETQRLKAEALAEIRALEARANRGGSSAKPGEEVVPWWDGPKPEGKAAGTLKQVDCIRGQARLVIETEGGKTIRLLVANPGQVAIAGPGDHTLSCGPQKPRKLRVEYVPKPDPKLATAGEVATIEFQ